MCEGMCGYKRSFQMSLREGFFFNVECNMMVGAFDLVVVVFGA